MNPRFIHLRIHTEYSLSDGIVQIPSLIARATELNMPALAISDKNNLFGIIKFYQEALKAGIKPIIGCDLWLYREKEPNHPHPFTLFCQNNAGYQNLLELISKRHPIHEAWLQEKAEGLIALAKSNEDLLPFWMKNFPDRYYFEVHRTGRKNEEEQMERTLDLAEKYAIPIAATNDVRFLKEDDFEAHEARVCIHEGWTLADSRRPKNYSDQQYFKSADEMSELFSDIPEALENTVEIAKRCNVTLTLGKNFLPTFPVPDGKKPEDFLSEEASKGLKERLQVSFPSQSTPYELRLQMELDVINKMGFAGYFLIVADFIRWARNHDVPVGPGRGSGPGSLVAYALKITDLDPLAHDLLFERFLNPERVSLPDFDIDFCMEGRDRVIEYVMQTHGRDKVAQIMTYGTMAARAVLRDVGRVLGMSYGYIDKLAKLIPFEIDMTLEKALSEEEILRERYQQEEEVRTLFDLARKLEGITRNVGKHAGGVVIAPQKLTQFTPLYCEDEKGEHIVTQFDKDDVESVGLVKFDFLGLRTLTIIHWAVRQINLLREKKGEDLLDIHFIPMNDAATFDILKACKTTAIFQLESRGMKDLVKRLAPDCFEDIVALVALFRPGPLQSGMVEDFINRKHGRAKVIYPHPKLEPILRPTYGVILYQEQVMQIAQVLAGYSLGSADLLRRAMGKKKPEEMAVQREIFCKGAEERGVHAEIASHIFDLMEKFAGYGFNKSHSASYALLSYQTAWLKAHYPAAYMAAVLSSDMDHTDKVVHLLEECKSLQLIISPPDVNSSQFQFTAIDEKNLSYGLGAIKGVGAAAIELICEARLKGEFKDLFDFCCRVDLRKVNRRVLEALIKAGAFDRIGPHRASIFKSIDLSIKQAEQVALREKQGQYDLFGEHTTPMDYLSTAQFSEHERLLGEKETLGFYLTGHPIHRYLKELNQFVSYPLKEAAQNKNAIIAGIITHIRTLQTKRGDRMAVLTLEDDSAQIDVLCFPETYHRYHELLTKDKLIIVEGEIGIDEFTQNFRVLSRDIFSIHEARERYAKHVKISFSEERPQDFTNLASILKKFQGGNCRIMIHYLQQKAKGDLTLGENWRVRPEDDLLDQLKELFSDEKVEVVYG